MTQRVLVPVLLVQLSVSGALFLVYRTVARSAHTVLTGLWLLPLALTALVVGGAGRPTDLRVLGVWGLFGLALTLWVFAHSLVGPLALTLCYSGPLMLLAAGSAGGLGEQATGTGAITVTMMAAAAVIAVPGVLVARAVSDLPRVHRWAGDADRWFSGRPEAVLWLVGAKVGVLMAYLAFARWQFPEQDFVPGGIRQWGMAVACAVFVIMPMRMARSRTMNDVRVRRLALTVGVVIAAAVALPVCLAIASVIRARGDVLGPLAVVVLLGLAVATSRGGNRGPNSRVFAVLLTPLAVLAGFLIPVSGSGPQATQEITVTWLAACLVVGGGVALVIAGGLAWRYGELWYGIRAVGFISIWIVLVTALWWTGTGLAGVDIALTVMLVGAAVWIGRQPRSRLAAIEVLALCAPPVIVIYSPGLLTAAPPTTRPWIVAGAVAAPGAAALWRHLGLDSGKMSVTHTGGLAGLGVLYGMVASSMLILGTTHTETRSDLAEVLLAYLVVPLAILFIAMLEGRDPGSHATT